MVIQSLSNLEKNTNTPPISQRQILNTQRKNWNAQGREYTPIIDFIRESCHCWFIMKNNYVILAP